MEIKHAYIEYDGTVYRDFLLEANVPSWRYDTDGKGLCLEDNVAANFTSETKLKQLCNSGFKPNKGDAIYVAPKCPYASEDLRKHYKIKRAPDTGVCNVFHPVSTGYHTYIYGHILIIPKLKVIFLADNPTEYAKGILGDNLERYGELVGGDNETNFWFRKYIDISDVYISLLNGTLIKPAVYYTDLDINSSNQLSLDTLRLVYETLKVSPYESDAEKNAVIQLNVLNQYDWRKYPGTISIMNEILKNNSCVGRDMIKTKSRYSKPIKELLSCPSYSWKSAADRHLSTEFISSLLNITGEMFVRPSDLIKKLNDLGLSLNSFDCIFHSVVKIKPVF